MPMSAGTDADAAAAGGMGAARVLVDASKRRKRRMVRRKLGVCIVACLFVFLLM